MFFRLFTLFERECHQLDLRAALIQSSTPALESYQHYSEALQNQNKLTDEIEEQQRELQQLDQLVSFLTLQLTSPEAVLPMQGLHQEVVNKKNKIKELVSYIKTAWVTCMHMKALLH